jgi:hypothetical protein
VVTEHIARADDHRFLLTNKSNKDREGKDHHKRGAPNSHKPDEFPWGHIGVPRAPRGVAMAAKRLRDLMAAHFSSLQGVAEKRRHREGR